MNDDEVNTILIASQACSYRKRPLNDLQPRYPAKLRKIADDTICEWALYGVPAKSWEIVKHSSLVR